MPGGTKGKGAGARTWDGFLCYRRKDGSRAARWLYGLLQGCVVPIGEADPPTLDVYFDQHAPAVSDWHAVHRPALERARAMIVVVTIGARARLGRDDNVHKEIDWWVDHRRTAPVLVDMTMSKGDWIPPRIRDRWPNVQWIDVDLDALEKLPESEREDAEQAILSRILDGIALSERGVRYEEFERKRRTAKQLKVLLAAAVLALAGALWQWWEADVAKGEKGKALEVANQSNKELVTEQAEKNKALEAANRANQELVTEQAEKNKALEELSEKNEALRREQKARSEALQQAKESAGKALQKQGEAEAALAALRLRSAELATTAAFDAFRLRRYDEALVNYVRAIRADPSNHAARLGARRLMRVLSYRMQTWPPLPQPIDLMKFIPDGHSESGRLRIASLSEEVLLVHPSGDVSRVRCSTGKVVASATGEAIGAGDGCAVGLRISTDGAWAQFDLPCSIPGGTVYLETASLKPLERPGASPLQAHDAESRADREGSGGEMLVDSDTGGRIRALRRGDAVDVKDGDVRLLRLPAANPTFDLQTPVAVSPDGLHVVDGRDPRRVQVWQVPQHATHVVEGVFVGAWRAQGSLVFLREKDLVLRSQDGWRKVELPDMPGHARAFVDEGLLLEMSTTRSASLLPVMNGNGRTVRVQRLFEVTPAGAVDPRWSLPEGVVLGAWLREGRIVALVALGDGKEGGSSRLAVVSGPRDRMPPRANWRVLDAHPYHRFGEPGAVFLRNGELCMLVSEPKIDTNERRSELLIFDTKAGNERRVALEGPAEWSLTTASDGSALALSGASGAVYVYDAGTKELHRVHEERTRLPNPARLALSFDGRHLLVSGLETRLFDLVEGGEPWVVAPTAADARFSADGKFVLVSAFEDFSRLTVRGEATVWCVASRCRATQIDTDGARAPTLLEGGGHALLRVDASSWAVLPVLHPEFTEATLLEQAAKLLGMEVGALDATTKP